MRVSDVGERSQGEPGELTVENALLKARSAQEPDRLEAVLGCDTVVALDREIYGKPADAQHARSTLEKLSGRTHEVVSGLALLIGAEERTIVTRTEVSFRTLDRATLDWYVALEEWRGRAGAYAIQGAGTALVRSIVGDYENVVGLPLATLLGIYPQLLPV